MTPPAAPKPRGFGAGVTKAPHPIKPLYRLATVAALFGRTTTTLYRVLSVHAERFDRPMYQRDGKKGYLYRVLSDHDVGELARCFPVYVKGKNDLP